MEKAAMDIGLFMKLQKRVRELEGERKRLQASVDKMEELHKRKVTVAKQENELEIFLEGRILKLFCRKKRKKDPNTDFCCETNKFSFHLKGIRVEESHLRSGDCRSGI